MGSQKIVEKSSWVGTGVGLHEIDSLFVLMYSPDMGPSIITGKYSFTMVHTRTPCITLQDGKNDKIYQNPADTGPSQIG